MEEKVLELNGVIIKPGEQADIKMLVGRLPSGGKIHIRGKVYRSKVDGPVVLITGGIHGDEINSVQIVRRFMDSGVLDNLLRGTVICIPVVNVYGFIYFSRDLPDGKDVNRSFPGSSSGSLASRIANSITKKIFPHVDIGLDFHTGGASRYNFPQIRYTKTDEKSKELARVFGAPQILSRGTIPKSLRRVALKEGKPFLVFEGGESLRLDGHSIAMAARGIRRVLHHLDMIENAPLPEEPSVHITATSWIRASQAGLFTWLKCSGSFVKKKEEIGIIQDPHGDMNIKVLATRDGYIVGHNNAAVVSQGDALFHLGYEYELWEV